MLSDDGRRIGQVIEREALKRAEQLRVGKHITEAIKKCAKIIDDAVEECGPTRTDRMAGRMTIVDWLTAATIVRMANEDYNVAGEILEKHNNHVAFRIEQLILGDQKPH